MSIWVIPKNTANAAERRIPFVLVDATDFVTPEDITVTGVKVSLSFGGGTAAASTNDIVKVDGATGRYYLELTQAEANNAVGPVHGHVQPSGCARTYLPALIGPADTFAAALSSLALAEEVLYTLAAQRGHQSRVSGGNLEVTAADGTTLVVQQPLVRSTTALNPPTSLG